MRSRIFDHWPAMFAQAKIMDSHAGFSGAIVERIEVGGQHFALRGWPKESLPAARLLGLHQFQRFLFERGFTQVSVPVPTIDGRSLVQHEKRFWQMEPWMPGKADFLKHPSDEKLKAVMHLLARLHIASTQFVASQESALWFSVSPSAPSPALVERIQILERWSGTNPETLHRSIQQKLIPEKIKDRLCEILSLYLSHAEKVHSELREMADHQFSLQPCLRDLWSEHVLWTANQVTGLIDFGACRIENPMIDLSRLLGSYFIDDSESYQKAIGWYDEIRSVSTSERKLFSVLDRSQRLLAGMTWIDRLVLTAHPLNDWSAVENRLDEILPRLRVM
ncbi:phosphotransferase [Planctomycetaceae bacterium]|nr:phosphotransferase [Planctomycetaceae bacterium]